MKKYIGLITCLLPLLAPAQLVLTNNFYVVLNGGSPARPTTVVLTDPAPSGITNTGTGWIISENEFNQVDWNIGNSAGNYVVPFGYGNTEYLPVSCNITASGTGSGSIKFATYHGATWDNATYEPSDVTNMTDFSAANYSKDATDRFWILDAQGYTTKPSPDITFTYIRNGASSEIAAPNYIVEADLIAQRFNSTNDEWYDWLGATGMDIASGNTGTVTSGIVPTSGFYRSWCLFNDSTLSTGIPTTSNLSSLVAYPNPNSGDFTVSGLSIGETSELYNYLGQLLTTVVAEKTAIHFDISSSPNGIYLVRVLSKDGNNIFQQKIIKAR